MKKILFLMMLLSLGFYSCSGDSLITSKAKKEAVKKAFEEKCALLEGGIAALEVFNNPLSNKEREALEFIYAYAPITDLAVDAPIYLDMVRATLSAKEEMSWADSIPEDIFLHFVLPPRVNNENIDSSRKVFYAELKDRVNGMSLKDAALEVNHWCHERVIYTPSDGRTSSPLASVLAAFGRCGEESVFTVSAMRAVGIPARQVYTPRWAHSDDNHAWVEIWGGDKWYYLGACEPEPVLDMGWFTAPSKRGMLMHTKVYGDYEGSEEVMMKNPIYTEINVTENYAPVKKVDVKILGKDGAPVEGASVEFRVFNYGSFTTVATKKTDTEGNTFITLGLGDVLIWATKDGDFGFDKLSVPNSSDVTITLDKKRGEPYTLTYDVVPPVEDMQVANVSEELKARNAARLLSEDSIRNSYVATFYNTTQSENLATKLSLPLSEVETIMTDSRGNHAQIEQFLLSVTPEELPTAMQLLKVISQKDLRDTRSDILLSHLRAALKFKGKYSDDIFNSYILNPRISSEMLESYRAELSSLVSGEPTASTLIDIVKQIKIIDALNEAVASVTPAAVGKLKISDGKSRDIFFVALSRSVGIPSRLELATGKVQYYNGTDWVDVVFEGTTTEVISPKGGLKIGYKPTKTVADPKYGTHFTISKINEDGKTRNVSVRGNHDNDMGPGASAKAAFAEPFALDTGNYFLTTGTRLASGAVLATLTFFDIEEGKNTPVEMVLRENTEDIFVIGSINAEAKVRTAKENELKSILDITGRGYFLLALIEPRKEPTNHAMRDMAKLKTVLEEWGRPVVIAVKNTEEWNSFDPAEFGELPAITYVKDEDGQVAKMFKANKLNTDNRPVFVIADTFGRVVYASEGYQINLGDHLTSVINKL